MLPLNRLCSLGFTLGDENIDDLSADVDVADVALNGVISIFEN